MSKPIIDDPQDIKLYCLIVANRESGLSIIGLENHFLLDRAEVIHRLNHLIEQGFLRSQERRVGEVDSQNITLYFPTSASVTITRNPSPPSSEHPQGPALPDDKIWPAKLS